MPATSPPSSHGVGRSVTGAEQSPAPRNVRRRCNASRSLTACGCPGAAIRQGPARRQCGPADVGTSQPHSRAANGSHCGPSANRHPTRVPRKNPRLTHHRPVSIGTLNRHPTAGTAAAVVTAMKIQRRPVHAPLIRVTVHDGPSPSWSRLVGRDYRSSGSSVQSPMLLPPHQPYRSWW